MEDRSRKTRAGSNFSLLPALLLSAALGLAFMGLVNKVHELLSLGQSGGPTVINTGNSNAGR